MGKALRVIGEAVLCLAGAAFIAAALVCGYMRLDSVSQSRFLFTPVGCKVVVDGRDINVYSNGEGDHTVVFMSDDKEMSLMDYRTICRIFKDNIRVVIVDRLSETEDISMTPMYSINIDRQALTEYIIQRCRE